MTAYYITQDVGTSTGSLLVKREKKQKGRGLWMHMFVRAVVGLCLESILKAPASRSNIHDPREDTVPSGSTSRSVTWHLQNKQQGLADVLYVRSNAALQPLVPSLLESWSTGVATGV